MAFSGGDKFEITLRAAYAGQNLYNVFQYRVVGAPLPIDAPQVVDAWWGHVAAEYRAIMQTSFGSVFQSALIRDLDDPAGDYAEYSIPVNDRTGTRPDTGAPQWLPTSLATGVRLTVGTRVTRPGQKRFWGATETDVIGNTLQPNWLGLVQTLADVLSTEMTLGDPAALMVLQPIVVRKSPIGAVVASQDVIGNVVNSYISSQVSRKQR